MHLVGIDIAAETHVAAALDEAGAVRLKPLPFTKGAAGYKALLAALDGSCHTPIAGYAQLLPGGRLRLDALVARADGSFLLRRGVECLQADAVRAGTDLGDSLRADSPADIFG